MSASAPGPDDPELAGVVQRELRLLDPVVRRDPSSVLALLHPDFAEVGASGRRWDGPAVAEAVADATDEPAARDVDAVRLSADVVLVTYRAHRPDRTSWRASVWVRDGDGDWRLRYHQGTPTG